jgi:hypothetical protein
MFWSYLWSLSFRLSHKCPICIPLLHSYYVFCPPHPLGLIILIILGEEYNLGSFSLYFSHFFRHYWRKILDILMITLYSKSFIFSK